MLRLLRSGINDRISRTRSIERHLEPCPESDAPISGNGAAGASHWLDAIGVVPPDSSPNI